MRRVLSVSLFHLYLPRYADATASRKFEPDTFEFLSVTKSREGGRITDLKSGFLSESVVLSLVTKIRPEKVTGR